MRHRPRIGGRKMADPAIGQKAGCPWSSDSILPILTSYRPALARRPAAVASSRLPKTDEARHEDRAHRPSEPDRRRYRPQRGVLQARARHEDREHGRRPRRTLFRPAEDPSRRRRRRDGDERRKTDAGAYLLYHRGADRRGRGPSRNCGVPVRMQGPRAGAIGTIQSIYIDDPDQNSIEISTY